MAAHGDSADAGLPGGREGSRPSLQHVVNVQGMRLATVLASFGQSVDIAFWNTRAWTYQERLLSHRRLYFTCNQVFFDCEHGQYREDMLIEPHTVTGADVVLYDTDPSSGTRHTLVYHKKLNLHVYEETLVEYTRRNLSYEEDILNAFQGVASPMARHIFNNSPVLFGIPQCLLDVALLWQPAGPLRRRQRTSLHASAFPSWSWVGWVGRFELDWYSNLSERTQSRVIWLNANGTNLALESEWTGRPDPKWSQWPTWERHVAEGQFVYYTKKGGDAETWFCHPIPDLFDPQPSPINFQTGNLHLRAEIARLTVKETHSGRWSESPSCKEGDHDKCELSILDSDGIRAGIVYVDGNTFRKLLPGLHYFIKLSQTTFSHADSDPAWDENTESYSGKPGGPPINPMPPLDAEDELFDQTRYDPNICWCLYNVLMIEWQNGMAYRAGVGQVHIYAFDGASPQWEKIVLA